MITRYPPVPPPGVAPTAPRLATEPSVAEAVVAAIVATEVSLNDAKATPSVDAMTAFHALEPPSIHVRDYVHRLASYSFSSTSCLLAAVHYVKRAVAKEPRLAPTSLAVHRLLITALVLAAKFFDDVTYSMSYYAKVGGLPVKELAYLELKLLTLLDFRLHIPTYSFHTLERDLIEALVYVPRSPIVGEAKKLIQCANIHSRPDYYCEALHPDDTVGYWLYHPAPNQHMLKCIEVASSPCQTPPRPLSPSHDSIYIPNSMHSRVLTVGPQASASTVVCHSAQGNGSFMRFDSSCSVVTLVKGSEGNAASENEDRQSGPLLRRESNTSTVTSEGSGCSEMSGSIYFDGDMASWSSAAGSHVHYPKASVYCRLGGNLSGDQWGSGQQRWDSRRRRMDPCAGALRQT